MSVKVNGEDAAAQVTVKEGADVVSFDGEKVTALKYGTAILTLSYQDGTEIYSQDVKINVARPLGVYSTTVQYFSALDGELPVSDIFGEEVTLVKAEQA